MPQIPASQTPARPGSSDPGPAPIAPGALTQFSLLAALMAGTYASGIRAAHARELGDFGIGCVDRLGGEVVMLDGVVYECNAGGVATPMPDDELLPFADACDLPHDLVARPVRGLGLHALTETVEAALASRNLFHAVRVDGLFSSLRVRTTARQALPLPTLEEVAEHQVETSLVGAEGTLVGFWSPALYQGVAVAGLHLHFLSADRSTGGHVLDATVADADLRLAAYARFALQLPTDAAFLATELTHPDDAAVTEVEGGG
ncbi:acetolactate decarboxylase [Microbacterium sp. LRZ72]|uniref:acetolactate decarboxylase n=1 Tax=Microbacterium sp. LRZ72 TaxID=2942481 RepID=UPI0029A001EF|nr:acetolactate decarboxylase [Microbacterium sp. LRZ72]MDX2377979.1 acetolactate decarboxylase [Microbacterium sp. LRZ72]